MADGSAAAQPALEELIDTAETILGGPVSSKARHQFTAYLELLRLWNKTQRLTGFDSAEEIVRGLFQDSMLFLPLLPPRPIRVVDIGAGAGIPGIPIRIADPGISLTLIESRRKRVSFLKSVTRGLGLEDTVRIFEGRAESLVDHVLGSLGQFDAAVARSVTRADHLFPLALRYVRPGGVVIASGPPLKNQVEETIPGITRRVLEYPRFGLARSFLTMTKDTE